MMPALARRDDAAMGRLVHVDRPTRGVHVRPLRDLVSLAGEGDLIVVNDAATLPAAVHTRAPTGEPIEIRLAAQHDANSWWAVVFGAGDWRTKTEDRPQPPPNAAEIGTSIPLGRSLNARVLEVSAISPRLVRIELSLESTHALGEIYANAQPVQYSYLRSEVAIWSVQNRFASRPWSVEPASAGFALDGSTLVALKRRGASIAAITHGAGLSSTGDPAIDAALPLPERFEVGANAVRAIRQTRERGRRVIAVGTSVVRALESAATNAANEIMPAAATTSLRLGRAWRLRVVDAVLTGIHEPESTHHDLLRAFADDDLLERALREAECERLAVHEYGDSMLVT